MRKFSALLVATALTVAPAYAAFAADARDNKEVKANSETTMTGRGSVDATGRPMGANPAGPAATQGADVRTGGGSGIDRGKVDPTGRATGANVLGNASMGCRDGVIGRGEVDPTGRSTGRYTALNAYEEAKTAALNMPQNTQAERDARAAAIARAETMRR